MARLKGSKDLKPRKNARPPAVAGSNVHPIHQSAAMKRHQAIAEGDKSNGINRDALDKAIGDYEEQDEILASLQAEYMNRCKGPRSRQKDILDVARGSGLPIRALKATLKARRYQKRERAVYDGLESDDQALFNLIRDELKAKAGPLVGTPFGDEMTSDEAVRREAQRRTAEDMDARRRADAVSSLVGD